jgi:hypothetical protein
LLEHRTQQLLSATALAIASQDNYLHEIVRDPVAGEEHNLVHQGRFFEAAIKNHVQRLHDSIPTFDETRIAIGEQLPLLRRADYEIRKISHEDSPQS